MLRPFSRFCVLLGAVPASIIESISYEEQLMRLIKFLKEKVIPAIDGNTEAIKAIENWIETLDLQDEVDNKLDQMAEDGTLLGFVKPYFDTYVQPQLNTMSGEITGFESTVNTTIDNYQASVDSSIQAQNNLIGQINTTVNSIATNTPIFVDSTSDMTDGTKVYVYTVNGHIYYYNTTSNAFADSGLVYGSDMESYLHYVGELNSSNNLNSISTNGWYLWSNSVPTNAPVSNSGGMMLNYYSNSDYRHYQMCFLYQDTTPIYIRHKKGSTWDSWKCINPLNVLYNTKDTTITDLNSDIVPGYLFLTSGDNITNKPSGVNNGLLINYADNGYATTRRYQIVIDYEGGQMYSRSIYNGAWTNWTSLTSYNTYQISAGKSLFVNLNGAKFVFARYTDNSISQDVYRLAAVIVGNTTINPPGGDIEGPVKELNTNDYVSGVHGHETFSSLKILIDGQDVTLATATAGYYPFKSIQIYEESTVTDLSDNNLANRNLMLEFSGNKLKVSQSWKFLKSTSLTRACCGGLFSSEDTALTAYSHNLDYLYNSASGLEPGEIVAENTNLTEFKYITTTGKSFIIRTLTKDTTGYVTDYTPGRLKNYFFNVCSDDGVSYSANDTMNASFEIEVI